MIDAILAHIAASSHEIIAIRAIHGQAAVRAGDILPCSYRWDDGESTGEQMPGTSALYLANGMLPVDEAGIARAMRLFREYEAIAEQVVLVTGELVQWGEDSGEVVLRNAVVLEVLR